MLNYETLLSSYDDKLTLMQWLKKVEAALKDASAVSFKVNKRGDATLTFSVVFEDGSELETGPITLQQGESVQAATITNGHLILTLTNGDELDAGDLGGVSGFSIDASQHLIVTYQSGRTQDLGAIFTGDVTLTGDLTAVGVHATGTGVKTSVISQDVSSGIDIFASVVSLNNGLEAQGTIKADKLQQESANEALNIGIGIGSGLTTEAIYNKFVVINGVAYVVFNYKIKNDTGSDVTIYSAGNAYVNMLTSTAEKVIDLAGVNVHATTSTAHITFFKGAALSSDYSLLKEINCSLRNTSAVDQAQINFSVSGGLTIPANGFVYFTGRAFLTLLG